MTTLTRKYAAIAPAATDTDFEANFLQFAQKSVLDRVPALAHRNIECKTFRKLVHMLHQELLRLFSEHVVFAVIGFVPRSSIISEF